MHQTESSQTTATPNARIIKITRRPYPVIAAALLMALLTVALVGALTGRFRPTLAPGSGTAGPYPRPTTSNEVVTTGPLAISQLQTTLDPATGLPANGALSDIWFSGPNDGYAVGSQPAGTLIMHYDGQRWSPINEGITGGDLLGVWGLSASDIWAVGDEDLGAGNFQGIVVHLADGHVKDAIRLNLSGLSKIRMISPTEGWAIGQTEADGAFVAHVKDGIWTSLNLSGPSGLRDAHGLVALSPNDVYIAGSQAIFRRQNDQWQIVDSSFKGDMLAAAMLSPTDCWFGGAGLDPGKRANGFGGSPEVIHYDGTTWKLTNLHSVVPVGNIYGLAFASPTHGWAVGDIPSTDPHITSNALLLEYTNGAWYQYPKPLQVDPSGVVMTSDTDGWAVGATRKIDGASTAAILRLQNDRWSLYHP